MIMFLNGILQSDLRKIVCIHLSEFSYTRLLLIVIFVAVICYLYRNYIKKFFKWIWQSDLRKKLWIHLLEFSYIWLLLIAIFVAAICSLYGEWNVARIIIWVSISLIVLLLFIRPLNAVYGLMGTSGSISVLFFTLSLFCIMFSCIYYWGFFKTAGISYDVNQPHISYRMFDDSTEISGKIQLCNLFKKPSLTCSKSTSVNSIDTVYLFSSDALTVKDTIIQKTAHLEERTYQNVDYQIVLRNTVLTFLMQEPTDLFAAAATYNTDLSGKGQTLDKQMAESFHWILIIQVLIGWIFFGVFISLLYNKFRYES